MIYNYIKLYLYRYPRIFFLILIRFISFYKSILYSKKKYLFNGHKQNILFNAVELNHGQNHQFFYLAHRLKKKGHYPILLICDGVLPRCEIKSSRNIINPCLECKASSFVLPKLFNIKTYKYSDLLSNSHIDKVAFDKLRNDPYVINACDESITRFYYGKPPKNNSPEYRNDFIQELTTYYLSYSAISSLYNIVKFDKIVSNMFVYSTWAPHYKFSFNMDIPYKVISATAYSRQSVVLNRHLMYENHNKFNDWLNSRKSRHLSRNELDSLKSFINIRALGKDHILKKYNYNQLNNEDYFLKEGKINICFYSNIYWDIGLVKYGGVFDDVIKWLISSIITLIEGDKDGTKYNIIIKTHPAEYLDSVKSEIGVKDILRSRLTLEQINRITFITPFEKVSPYILGRKVDLNVVYNGTIGLELFCMGITNVLIGGPAPYRFIVKQHLFNINDYNNILCQRASLPSIDFEFLNLFGYFYFIGECINWPYTTNSYGTSFFLYTSEKKLNNYLINECNYIEDWILK